jgi:hypothetical protein
MAAAIDRTLGRGTAVKTVLGLVLAITVGILGAAVPAMAADIVVYRQANCDCCGKWAEYMQAAGHSVTIVEGQDMSEIKRQYGVPGKLASCHTAIADGYVIEGHVPAEDVERLLKDRPTVKGLAVPGMPLGSPGMEQADGSKEPFDVIAFGDGGESVFASHK